MGSNKKYTMKEFRDKYLPNHDECGSCGGLHLRKELITCLKCNKKLCEHCQRRHRVHEWKMKPTW